MPAPMQVVSRMNTEDTTVPFVAFSQVARRLTCALGFSMTGEREPVEEMLERAEWTRGVRDLLAMAP